MLNRIVGYFIVSMIGFCIMILMGAVESRRTRCTDKLECRCVPFTQTVVCIDTGITVFPSPYGYWGHRIRRMYLAGNQITDIDSDILSAWTVLDYDL